MYSKRQKFEHLNTEKGRKPNSCAFRFWTFSCAYKPNGILSALGLVWWCLVECGFAHSKAVRISSYARDRTRSNGFAQLFGLNGPSVSQWLLEDRTSRDRTKDIWSHARLPFLLSSFLSPTSYLVILVAEEPSILACFQSTALLHRRLSLWACYWPTGCSVIVELRSRIYDVTLQLMTS